MQPSLLHLLLSEALLHAEADEVLSRLRDPAQNLPQTQQSAQKVRVKTRLLSVHLLQGVDEATATSEVSQSCQVLLVDHVETASCTDGQHDAQVEQVHLFQLVYRVEVHALLNTWLIESVVLVHEEAEFAPDQLGLARKILYVSA